MLQPNVLTQSILVIHFRLQQQILCGSECVECVECARRIITIKSVATSTAPNHLALGMKRFLFDRHTCSLRKERRAVTLRESLVLQVTSHVVSYELYMYAIVVHAGVTLDSGHYYS